MQTCHALFDPVVLHVQNRECVVGYKIKLGTTSGPNTDPAEIGASQKPELSVDIHVNK